MKKIYYVLILIFLISTLIYLYTVFKPVTMINYLGREFYFRDDIRDAKKVIVYPDEKTVHDMFWDKNIKNITIIFKPLDKGNQYYSLQAFELTYKLSIMYMMDDQKKNFNADYVDSYEDIQSSEDVLKIALIPPSLTNRTYVEGKNNIIYVYAKDYRDFDLATIKTILVAMGSYT